MKPFTKLACALLLLVALAHLIRLINGWHVVVGGRAVPLWVSAVAFVVPLVLAALVWRENRQP